MRKLAPILLATSLSIFTSVPAHADACQAAICLWGKMTGDSGGSECNSAIAEYFAIIVWGKHGKIKWGSTASKRLSHLNSCPNANQSQTKQINNKFGRTLG